MVRKSFEYAGRAFVMVIISGLKMAEIDARVTSRQPSTLATTLGK